jgi:hypothetical protein
MIRYQPVVNLVQCGEPMQLRHCYEIIYSNALYLEDGSLTTKFMKKKKTVVVNDKMQNKYRYALTEKPKKNFDLRFKPEFTPKEMLQLGVFGGKYMTDCKNEFPADWFKQAKLCPEKHNPKLNFFGVNASQPLSVWRKKRWIYHEDPRGWFQWYCRYYMGRRIPKEDDRQIKRWIAIKRHITQIRKNCIHGDWDCRKKQRQAVLHWAYDSRKM